MPMLGNDVVDFAKANLESNWNRKGYLDKLFNNKEKETLENSCTPNQVVWQLWSMKEAVYKIIHKIRLERFYSPKKFNCKINGDNGIVEFEGQHFYTQSYIDSELIHTIASCDPKAFLLTQTSLLAYQPTYLTDFNKQSADYHLQKNDLGIPFLTRKVDGMEFDTSISHHGRFLAIVHQKEI